ADEQGDRHPPSRRQSLGGRSQSRTGLVYVSNQAQRLILVINGQTNKVTAKIRVPFPPAGIAVNPLTDKVYVGRFRGHNVAVIDGKTNTVIATIGVAYDPLAVAVNPLTDTAYATGRSAVSVISGRTNK